MQLSNFFLLTLLFLSVQISWTMTKVKQNALAPEQKDAFLSKLAPEVMKNHNQEIKEKVMIKKQEVETFEFPHDVEIKGGIQEHFKDAVANIQDRGSPSLEDYKSWSDEVTQFIQSTPYDDYPSYYTN